MMELINTEPCTPKEDGAQLHITIHPTEDTPQQPNGGYSPAAQMRIQPRQFLEDGAQNHAPPKMDGALHHRTMDQKGI